jgi:hypothetical protein
MSIRGLIVAAAVAVGGSLVLPGAQALALTHPLLGEFGSVSVNSSEGLSSDVAVDQASGNVFIPNTGSGKYAEGALETFGAEGGAPADGLPAFLEDPRILAVNGLEGFFRFSFGGVAVDNACAIEKLSGSACTAFDPSNGYIYLDDVEAQIQEHVVEVYSDRHGEFQYVCEFNGFTEKGGKECTAYAHADTPSPEDGFGSTSLAVDRKGDVYIATEGWVYEYNSAGEDLMKFEVQSLLNGAEKWVGVDRKGDIYVNAEGGTEGLKLVELVRSSLTGAVESSKEIAPAATGFALDQATGGMVVDEGSVLVEYNEAGEVVSKFGEGVLAKGGGVAINEATGAVYAINRQQPPGSFNPSTATAVEWGPLGQYASVATGPTSGVQGVSATVTGTVNSESATQGASCQVRYGPTSTDGSTAPCSPASIPAGVSEVPVTASLQGLEGNTTYHYRVAATNTAGVNVGADHTFTTLPERPAVLGELAVTTSPNEAVLAAAVAPENEATTYHFVYGTTAVYGLSFPVHNLSLSSRSGPTLASLSVGELQPGTTYHYAVVATNGAGSRVGPDQTFTTPPGPAPIVITGGASEVAQNTATISGTVAPQGVQSTYEFDLGTDTDYGVRIFADAGSGAGQETFTLGLRSLQPGTVYHYRVVATNAYGTTYGADQTFTTTTFPTSVLAAPGSEPLVATPAFVEPSTAGAIVPNPATKAKPKQTKAGKKHPRARKRHKAKKASKPKGAASAAHDHGNGRSK